MRLGERFLLIWRRKCPEYLSSQFDESSIMATSKRYWLVKSEPTCFSIQDLAKSPKQTTCWSGVRNFQARNSMRDQMKLGDRVLFYHSSVDPPAVVGTAVVAREGYPDHTAWDPRDEHYDPKSTGDNPIWQMVDVRLEEIFPEPISLDVLKSMPALTGMELLRRGSRLSVQPVSKEHFEAIVARAHARGSAKKSLAAASRAPKPGRARKAARRSGRPAAPRKRA